MKFKRLLTTTVLSLLVVFAATAQDENRGKLKSYSFIEVQGGGQMTYTNFDKKDLVTPTAAISVTMSIINGNMSQEIWISCLM